MQGNIIAQLVLLVWLPLSLVLATSVPSRRAVLLIIVGGTLLLPEGVAYDFPVVPPLDKHAISALSAFVACLASDPKSVTGPQTTNAARYAAILATIGVLGTVLTNGDEVRFGRVSMQALSAYDSLAFVVTALLRIVLPFYLGQALFRTPEHLRELLRALVWGALLYIPLILIEGRLSPIFHLKLYGFFQHDFLQAMRAGGFRAFVFMAHGLAVAFFVAQALICVAGLARIGDKEMPLSPRWMTMLLLVALISCKSMGAFIYAGIAVPLIAFASTKMQLRFARWLALLVLLFPLARMFDFVPTEWLLEKANAISPDRAQSLEFRFDNEEMLLARAQSRPVFGWGSYGRNHLINPEDGKPMTIADGEWIIQFGAAGAFGFLTVFGMLLLPVLRARKAALRVRLEAKDEAVLATFAVLVAFIGLDLIPNAVFNMLPYFIAGALGSVSAGILAGERRRGRTSQSPSPASS